MDKNDKELPLEISELEAEIIKENNKRDIKRKNEELKKLKDIKGLYILKKSRFYSKDGTDSIESLREHFATYKDYVITIKQNMERKTLENGDEVISVDIAVVTKDDIKLMKRINSNKVRKMMPNTINDLEKISALLNITKELDAI